MVVDWIDLGSCESIPGRMFSIIFGRDGENAGVEMGLQDDIKGLSGQEEYLGSSRLFFAWGYPHTPFSSHCTL